ncbi:hemerythrin domain-containing protein [Sphingomonas sp.]|uniref:hemerythrin domain-containing protein n=1 Tax=Sphingomonas sp. TaxID=28214 RepID=UPI003CC623CA
MDITHLILDEHAQQRQLFALIDEIDPSDTPALTAIWGRLRALLDAHAEAEERFFYPRLMQVGTGGNDAPSAAEETEDAIEDHNEIRDAATAVEKEAVGSDAWFAAVGKANKANGDHMAEEERQGLTDFRKHASVEERHALGIRFAAFEAQHLMGVEPVDKDPKQWVKEHKPR